MVCNDRTALYPINELFLTRQSAYALTGEAISQAQLMMLFEAARWAPSSYNNQPTRFIYAHRNTPQWKSLFDLMVPANQSWAQHAAVLVVTVSKQTMGTKNTPSPTHSFEAGAAWMSLVIQAEMMGLVVHGMSGFDYEKAQTALGIPANFTVEIMCAIGKRATQHADPSLLDRDAKPTERKSLETIAAAGQFSFNE
jgi:nitroreductase